MRWKTTLAVLAVVAINLVGACATPKPAQPVTAFEGARVIAGDGRVMENGTLLVEGTKLLTHPGLEAARLTSTSVRPVAQAFFGIQARNLAKLNAAGVRITLGTDGNRPWGPNEEMEDMVITGMTPMQVIVGATRNSAEFLRITDAGTLEAGNSADFIVLDANPLDNITNTRRISAVYLRAASVDRTQPVR